MNLEVVIGKLVQRWPLTKWFKKKERVG